MTLIQIASLFGVFSISFLIAAFASFFEYAVYIFKTHGKIAKELIYFLVIFVAVYIYGGIVLQIPLDNEKMKVVSVAGYSNIEYIKTETNRYQPISQYISYTEELMQEAVRIKPKLFNFAETSFNVHEYDYEELADQLGQLAYKYTYFLSVGFDILLNNFSS